MELAVAMQFDEHLKPGSLRQNIRVGSGPPGEPAGHGGVTQKVRTRPWFEGDPRTPRDYVVEHLPDARGRHFWFRDAHGHPEVGFGSSHGIRLADGASQEDDGRLDGSITFPPAADGSRDVDVFLDFDDTLIRLTAR